MCDYSLHAVATRPAEVAETLSRPTFQPGLTALRARTIRKSRSAFVLGPR